MDSLTTHDLIAIVWLLGLWGGYALYADNPRQGGRSLMGVMHEHRKRWMKQMLGRENRMVDANIIGTVMRSVSLFATTTIFIVGGLIAVLGSVGKAQAVVSAFPFAVEASAVLWEIKIIALIFIYIYAFFKFAWSLRQFNYCVVFVGVAPAIGEGDETSQSVFIARAASVISLAVHSYNQGLRAYYFGLATLAWFVHPGLFMVATLWVVLVLYRREFRSRMVKALSGEEVLL